MDNLKCNEFNRLYNALTDNERDKFSIIALKLIKVNFLLRIKNLDYYLFILQHKELFRLYFDFINFELYVREDKEVIYIKNDNTKLGKNLTKNETLCLLVLRLLYEEKLKEVSLSNDIEVSATELQNKLYATTFDQSNNDRVKKTNLDNMLKVFRLHDIIDYKSKDLGFDNTIITIYPSIEVAMDFKEISDVINRLELLSGDGDLSEE